MAIFCYGAGSNVVGNTPVAPTFTMNGATIFFAELSLKMPLFFVLRSNPLNKYHLSRAQNLFQNCA
jgi:hypothetical protein